MQDAVTEQRAQHLLVSLEPLPSTRHPVQLCIQVQLLGKDCLVESAARDVRTRGGLLRDEVILFVNICKDNNCKDHNNCKDNNCRGNNSKDNNCKNKLPLIHSNYYDQCYYNYII